MNNLQKVFITASLLLVFSGCSFDASGIKQPDDASTGSTQTSSVGSVYFDLPEGWSNNESNKGTIDYTGDPLYDGFVPSITVSTEGEGSNQLAQEKRQEDYDFRIKSFSAGEVEKVQFDVAGTTVYGVVSPGMMLLDETSANLFFAKDGRVYNLMVLSGDYQDYMNAIETLVSSIEWRE